MADRDYVLRHEADKAFQDHELKVEGEGRWLCARPGTGIYHFRVITAPACLILYGDIKDVIFRISDRDALAWLRGSIDSMDYVLGKAVAFDEGHRKVFARGNALRELAELAKEDPARAEKVREHYERYRDFEGEARAWAEAMSNVGMDPTVPEDWDSQLVWQYHALRHFLRLLGAVDPLHVCDQEGQPYGSARQCCNHCGVALVQMRSDYKVPRFVETRTEWSAAADNCSKALKSA